MTERQSDTFWQILINFNSALDGEAYCSMKRKYGQTRGVFFPPGKNTLATYCEKSNGKIRSRRRRNTFLRQDKNKETHNTDDFVNVKYLKLLVPYGGCRLFMLRAHPKFALKILFNGNLNRIAGLQWIFSTMFVCLF